MFSKEKCSSVLERIRQACLRSGRNAGGVKVLAAVKGRSTEEIRAAVKAGVKLFGENYVQEAAKKIEFFPGLEWHFIGGLQSNKVKKAVELFSVIESVDREKIARKVNAAAGELGEKQDCFIEVNIGGEEQKHGVRVKGLREFAESCAELEHLNVKGLMCSAPFVEAEQTRPYFRKMRELLQELTPLFGDGFKELSMGMSNDFEVAVEEGSTEVRLGSALFGGRA